MDNLAQTGTNEFGAQNPTTPSGDGGINPDGFDTEEWLPSKSLYVSRRALARTCRTLLDRATVSSSATILCLSVTTTAHRESACRWTRMSGVQVRNRDSRPRPRSRDRRSLFPAGSELWHYEGTYSFNALDDTPLQKGQVTARGVALFDGENVVDPPVRFAITGGTGPCSTAHGTVTEGVPEGDHRLLVIEL